MTYMDKLVVVFPLLLHLLVRANIHDDENADFAAVNHHLPEYSSDVLLASHSCTGDDVKRLLENGSGREQHDDPFFRWVLSAIHTTRDPPGWEVALPRLNHRTSSSGDDASTTAEEEKGDKYYARVFDLLNFSREGNLLPVPIDIASICHKGMNSTNTPEGGGHLSDERQSAGLLPWRDACLEKLASTTRVSSSCIDIPGVIIANPTPPMRVNNPCHLPYRMVDGAHRICLRKYILHVATAELAELENLESAAASSEAEENIGRTANLLPNDDDDGARLRKKRELREVIGRTRYAPYLVLNQTTFESMLTSVDPHSSWARDKHRLTRVVTRELRMEWQAWMGRVMDRVLGCHE